jgi:carboxyl-terminal processing protease
VLTTNRTASASEAVINGLRPYYDVYLLGERTEGKNVGSITLTNDKYDYELHPIVCRIFNVQNQSEYEGGFPSNWEPDEPNSDYRPIVNHVELGDKENDVLLKAAIYWIRNGVKPPVTGFTRSSGLKLTPGYCSLDRKATNGVQVPF